MCSEPGVVGIRALQQMEFQFHLSVGTLPNYIPDITASPLYAFSDDPICMIKLPYQEERKEMEGLVYVFPKCVDFVDGMKQHFGGKDHTHNEVLRASKDMTKKRSSSVGITKQIVAQPLFGLNYLVF